MTIHYLQIEQNAEGNKLAIMSPMDDEGILSSGLTHNDKHKARRFFAVALNALFIFTEVKLWHTTPEKNFFPLMT